MRKVLYALLITGLFLLMLSALVVTPETADGHAAAQPHADFHAVFRPLVQAVLPEAAAAASNASELRLALCLLPALFLCAASFAGVRDANGRVLTAVRYENSVYQLFRPEVAGG